MNSWFAFWNRKFILATGRDALLLCLSTLNLILKIIEKNDYGKTQLLIKPTFSASARCTKDVAHPNYVLCDRIRDEIASQTVFDKDVVDQHRLEIADRNGELLTVCPR